MKKIILSFVLLLSAITMFAQELQLHFDPRHGLHSDVAPRNYATATFQMFKPDKWGSTFAFVDLDFNQSRGNIGLAYMELGRNIKMGKCPLMAHLEFNGGVGKGFTIPNAYLAGLSYSKAIGGVNIESYIAYKYHAFEKVSNDVQWTGIWNANLINNKITLAGFVDIWSENKNRLTGDGGKKVIFLTEPQVWYNVDKHLAFGTEVEISNNFYSHYKNRVYVCPTIAGKWTF